MRKLFKNIEEKVQFNNEKAMLKQSSFIKKIINMMQDSLMSDIYEDICNASRGIKNHTLTLSTTSRFATDSEFEETLHGFHNYWIDIVSIRTTHSDSPDRNDLKVSDLIFEDDCIIDPTGYRFSFQEINMTKNFLYYYELIEKDNYKHSNRLRQKEMHNIMNGTIRSTQVPTIMLNHYYCSDCQSWHSFTKKDIGISVDIFEKTIICPKCNSQYHINDIKCVCPFESTPVYSSIFFDESKITFSNKTLTYGIRNNKDDRPFWTYGTHKLTMNLETGYSYRTLSGSEYSLVNRQGNKIPKFYNCTYECHRVSYDTLGMATTEIFKLIEKYKDHKNLINLINKRHYELKNMILDKKFNAVDNYMTNYYINKFGYQVPKLFKDDKESHNYSLYTFVIKNRFINLTNKDLRIVVTLLDNLRNTKNYKLMSRTAPTVIDIILPYLKIKTSKNLRKELIKMISSAELKDYHKYSLINFFSILSRFKNKECQNTFFKNQTKITNIIKNEYDESLNRFIPVSTNIYPLTKLGYIYPEDLSLLFQLRDEKYIAKSSTEKINDISYILQDCTRVIREIQDVLGDDWNPLDLKFKNEQQFHDDLVKILNSDTVREIRISKDNNPFEMEDEIYALEEPENNIHIAKVGAELTIIGQQMGICVGGYVSAVRRKQCRIAYIIDPVSRDYKVCLELRPVYNKDTNGNTKTTYTLNQAKLNSNRLVSSNPELHKLVYEWCNKHNIAIETKDMMLQQERREALAELGF